MKANTSVTAIKAMGTALALCALSVPAMAQEIDGDAPAAGPVRVAPGSTAADIRRGAVIIRSFNVVLNSDDISQAVKGKLLECMYNNSIRAISVASGRVLANNSTVDAENPSNVYIAASGVCGLRREASADGNQAQGNDAD